MRIRLTGVMALAMLLIVGMMVPATATSNDQIMVCHATASATTPYAQADPQMVAKSSIASVKHDGGQPPRTYYLEVSGHGDHSNDIIPPFTVHASQGDISNGADPSYEYPGLNWTTEGQAIWNNDCEVPQVVPEQPSLSVAAPDLDVCVGESFTVAITNNSSVPVTVSGQLTGPGIPAPGMPVTVGPIAPGAVGTHGVENAPTAGVYTVSYSAFDDTDWMDEYGIESNTINGSFTITADDCSEPLFAFEVSASAESVCVFEEITVTGANDGETDVVVTGLLTLPDGGEMPLYYEVAAGASFSLTDTLNQVGTHTVALHWTDDSENSGSDTLTIVSRDCSTPTNGGTTPPPTNGGTTPPLTPTPAPVPVPEVTPGPDPTEVLPEVIEADPAELEVVEEEEEAAEQVVEEVEVRGVTVTRAVPTGIDAGTGGYLPGSTPTAVLLLLMLGGLALTAGATASSVRRRG